MLDETQMHCLEALMNTIIPADDYPGAWEAGVGDYLLRQLRGDLAHLLPAYQQWLGSLDREARKTAGAAFADLDGGARANLLRRVERGDVRAKWSIEPAAFFAEVVEHCAEGYYSDPGNGGNRDGVAWRMIGFEVTG